MYKIEVDISPIIFFRFTSFNKGRFTMADGLDGRYSGWIGG